MSSETDEISKLIEDAEERSLKICENCGKDVPAGPTQCNRWVYMQCQECLKSMNDGSNLYVKIT